jgi:hypothetical protein
MPEQQKAKRKPRTFRVKTTEEILRQVSFSLPEVAQVSPVSVAQIRTLINKKRLTVQSGHLIDLGTRSQASYSITRKGFTAITGYEFPKRDLDLVTLAKELLRQAEASR